jgi:hypothetical protein
MGVTTQKDPDYLDIVACSRLEWEILEILLRTDDPHLRAPPKGCR